MRLRRLQFSVVENGAEVDSGFTLQIVALSPPTIRTVPDLPTIDAIALTPVTIDWIAEDKNTLNENGGNVVDIKTVSVPAHMVDAVVLSDTVSTCTLLLSLSVFYHGVVSVWGQPAD